jgi:hypothetical protein
MTEDRYFRPCELVELEDTVSILNEPQLDIVRRHELPLSAVMRNARSCMETQARHLEGGVRCHSDAQRDIVRRLYLRTRKEIEILVAALEALD